MLSQEKFEVWCQELELSSATIHLVKNIRSLPPSRRVQGGRGNVSGNYPSQKMGVTIQFESHKCELARIYELEHDDDVLEYYDQPPAIELSYEAKSGRSNRHCYTPDFFVVRSDSAGWEECKPAEAMKALSKKSPNRYSFDTDDQRWRCPPAEEYAARFGLSFEIWTDTAVNWIFQSNCIWLEDYLRPDSLLVDEQGRLEVFSVLEEQQFVSLSDLLQIGVSADSIYALIATQQIYVDLSSARLSQPTKVTVFKDQETAIAYTHLQNNKQPSLSPTLQLVSVEPSSSLVWDGQVWEVLNTGDTTTGLIRSDGKFIDLPNKILAELIQQGKILSAQPSINSSDIADATQVVEETLKQASPKAIQEANQRYECIRPFLDGERTTAASSTVRRWISSYRKAESKHGNGYIGLLPKHSAKGNKQQRIDETTLEFMNRFISDNYETIKHRGKLRVYESFVSACKTHEPRLTPPSLRRFLVEIKRRSGYKQTRKREGRRAAIQKKPFNWVLDLTTPRHGDRPFEIVHIDHTQLDIELISSVASLTNCNLAPSDLVDAQKLGRPWATFMVDAYSRRLLGVYITFEEPSYRACMMVLRICVKRFQRFPQSIVVDNGAEFHSHYFEQLLASFACTKKNRPPAHARFGSVVERLFGTVNTEFFYELQGNTQLSRLHRQVTKSIRPANQAVWTLADLYEVLCEWAYEVYDQRNHPALGQSPRDAFNQGLAIGGKRLHRKVEYDETFRILTLPAPQQNTRKVQPGRGVKINNLYYWSNEFRSPEIERTPVEVRYEPFDVGIAYAFVNGKWFKCISNDYQYLKGRSEKEIKIVSAELRKRRRLDGKRATETSQELVRFLDSVEVKEGELLKQRLKATENHLVSEIIFGHDSVPYSHEVEVSETPARPKLSLILNDDETNQKSKAPECYGEF